MTDRPILHRLTIITFGAALLVLLWSAVLEQDRRMAELRQLSYSQEMSNYVRLLEAHSRSVLRGLDQVVMHLKAEYEDNPAAFDLKAQVARSPILKGLSVQVGIIGADGFLLTSTAAVTTPSGERINLSDREHFQVHVAKDTGELWVGRPVLGRASGKWSIQLARRLNTGDGGFAGVIVVSLSPDYISDIYHSIELGQDSSIVAVGRDGIVRARASGDDRTVGQSFAQASFFAELWAAPEGFVRGISPEDGRPRLSAFRRLNDYPLVVMVSRPEETLAALSAQEHRLFLGAGWGATLLIVAGTLMLLWQASHRFATERQLREREAELKVAHTSLERKNQDLEQFTEVLAHHLQEPVRLQYGFGQRLQRLLGDSLDAEAHKALEYILSGAVRLRSLLHDVELYLSLDRLPPRDGPTEITGAIRQALAGLTAQAAGAVVTVSCDDLPPVAIDARRCTNIFAALISNAFTYRRPDANLDLRITGHRDGDMVTIAVTDNGLGIAPEYRERVFRVFERLYPNSAYPGTGIGLSLVKKVVETARGQIRLEDGISGGVSVILSLPVHKE